VVDAKWAAAFAQHVLGIKEAPRSLAFEFVDDPEERAHFDFVIELESGARVCVHAKLAELGFGTLDLTTGERARLHERLAPKLAALVDGKWLEPDAFFRRYQLLRTLACLDRPGNLLYLVAPRANESLAQTLRILPEITAGALADRVRILYLEDAVERIGGLLRGRDEALKAHYRELREKYLPE
jgi:hypothetical protein